MASLVVLKFETADGAQQGLTLSEKLQKQQLTEILDAATVTWPQGKGKPKTRHLGNLTKVGALDGAFWGMLFGLLFFAPVIGMAIGAAFGALTGHFAHYGFSTEFIDQVRQKVTEGKQLQSANPEHSHLPILSPAYRDVICQTRTRNA